MYTTRKTSEEEHKHNSSREENIYCCILLKVPITYFGNGAKSCALDAPHTFGAPDASIFPILKTKYNGILQ